MAKQRITWRRILSVAVFAVFLAGLVIAVYREQRLQRPVEMAITTSGRVDMCLTCHTKEKLDSAHDGTVIGCTPCHLGDPLAIRKDQAHKGIILNPGDLRIVEQTCGVESCHPTDPKRVHNSLMATNRGILGTLLYYWGESDSQNTDLTVKDLLDSKRTSLALDYFRKLCATCHLWKQKNDLPGEAAFFNEKGGGCSACHVLMPPGHERPSVIEADDSPIPARKANADYIHPLITSSVPDDNCIRCHNRSGRIGLAYIGVFESEGYGTPYEQGQLSSNKMPGNRFYLQLADDIHHRRGMSCIDCHTQNEIMGDGTSYAHYEDQLEISCQVCHSDAPGTTRKNDRLTNVVEQDGGFGLIGKNNDKRYALRPPKETVCAFPAHRRVTCEACHSSWVPQCYGCHVRRDASKTHLDKLSLQETPGRWQEGRSYIRYEQPMLAVWGDEVVIVTPGCQDLVSLFDASGTLTDGFNRFTMAAINPHTTQEGGRGCADCHVSTRTVGLGEGTLSVDDGIIHFEPLDKGVQTVAGQTVGFDVFVSLDGTPLQHGSRKDLRPFNGDELRRILRVGLCVGCHDSYEDPLWQHYNETLVCTRPDADNDLARARWPGQPDEQPPAPSHEVRH